MNKKVLIFGGSGFIGSSLSNSLLKKGNEVYVICTDTIKALNRIGYHKNLHIKKIDIFDKEQLKKSLKNIDVVINLIGKLFEVKDGDFAKFHHQFPEILCKCITKKQQFIHLSALGIEDSSETSIYARTKLDGENVVIKNSGNYNIIKPSIVFGKEDNFFNQFAKISKISPFLPLIGGGEAKFAPIYVNDLTKVIISLIDDSKSNKNTIFEAYGPTQSSFKELMAFIIKTLNKRRLLLTLPFSLAKVQARIMNLLGIYLLTQDQVELLRYNNIGSNKYKNIDKIIGKLSNYEDIVPKYLNKK